MHVLADDRRAARAMHRSLFPRKLHAPTRATLPPITKLPSLRPDTEIARNTRRHILSLPGDNQAYAYRTFSEAVTTLIARGFEKWFIHTDAGDYLCTPSLFVPVDEAPPPTRTRLDTTPAPPDDDEKGS